MRYQAERVRRLKPSLASRFDLIAFSSRADAQQSICASPLLGQNLFNQPQPMENPLRTEQSVSVLSVVGGGRRSTNQRSPVIVSLRKVCIITNVVSALCVCMHNPSMKIYAGTSLPAMGAQALEGEMLII